MSKAQARNEIISLPYRHIKLFASDASAQLQSIHERALEICQKYGIKKMRVGHASDIADGLDIDPDCVIVPFPVLSGDMDVESLKKHCVTGEITAEEAIAEYYRILAGCIECHDET